MRAYMEGQRADARGDGHRLHRRPDLDFVLGMLAHHRGAVEMAAGGFYRAGTDPEVRALAEEIVAASRGGDRRGWRDGWSAMASRPGFSPAAPLHGGLKPALRVVG